MIAEVISGMVVTSTKSSGAGSFSFTGCAAGFFAGASVFSSASTCQPDNGSSNSAKINTVSVTAMLRSFVERGRSLRIDINLPSICDVRAIGTPAVTARPATLIVRMNSMRYDAYECGLEPSARTASSHDFSVSLTSRPYAI